MKDRPEQPTDGRSRSSATDAASSSAKRARPWYRLHASTYVAVLLGATTLFFVNVPGQLTPYVEFDGQEKYSVEFHVNERIEHGWPWCYLRRDIFPSSWNWNSNTVPEPVSVWALTEEVTEFRSLPLLADIAVGIVVLAAR
jgi:hypothetical protein